jgi:type I restriction enzyme M protein
MREKLVLHDIVECVLGLGPNLFYNSPMEACVVVCRMSKPRDRRGRILFINAVNEVTRERAQSFLEDEHIEKILGAYRDFADVDGFCHVATLDDIRANNFNLSIPLYVRVNGSAVRERNNGGYVADDKSLATVMAEWQASSHALRVAMDELLATIGPKARSV